MDLFAKGILQGSVPVIVLVGGTHYFVKKFRESKPVLYWGSLAVATGAAIGIVTGRIPAPFMKAETFEAKEKIDLSKSALKDRIRDYERKYHDVSEEEVDTTYDTIQGIGLIDELKRCYKAE